MAVEVREVGWSERIRLAPHLVVADVGEGVLHVELDVVDLPTRQALDRAPRGSSSVGTLSLEMSIITPRTEKSGQSVISHSEMAPPSRAPGEPSHRPPIAGAWRCPSRRNWRRVARPLRGPLRRPLGA